MSKFVTEDGNGVISGDKLYDDWLSGITKDPNYFTSKIYPHKRHTEISKLKIPYGRTNGFRLDNMNIYDLLSHIQETLSLTNRCVIELITNEDRRCLNMNNTIQRRINRFAEDHITDSFKETYPRRDIRITKIKDDDPETRPETDEEWHDRLCHLYMHKFHPARLQMIKCEECIQKWLNDDKW